MKTLAIAISILTCIPAMAQDKGGNGRLKGSNAREEGQYLDLTPAPLKRDKICDGKFYIAFSTQNDLYWPVREALESKDLHVTSNLENATYLVEFSKITDGSRISVILEIRNRARGLVYSNMASSLQQNDDGLLSFLEQDLPNCSL